MPAERDNTPRNGETNEGGADRKALSSTGAPRVPEQEPSNAQSTRERPILFSGSMVRAILAGQKTQTRRVAMMPVIDHDVRKSIPVHTFYTSVSKWSGRPVSPVGHDNSRLWVFESAGHSLGLDSPFLEGDTLWVRETWQREPSGQFIYAATPPDYGDGEGCDHWRPSIFMPREACRIRLRIIGVRLERVQDISESDAMCEGVDLPAEFPWRPDYLPHRESFAELWDSINGKRKGCSWDANPWVWVVLFERVHTKPVSYAGGLNEDLHGAP